MSSIFVLPNLPTPLNQADDQSCVANALAYTILFMTSGRIMISRLFVYANGRITESHTLSPLVGMSVNNACNSILTYGVVPESTFTNFEDDSKIPPQFLYKLAYKYRNFQFQEISKTLGALKSVLLSGRPIIFLFPIFDAFDAEEVQLTGIIKLPSNPNINTTNHCMTIVGFNDETQQFFCANSWGNEWGYGGFAFLPYSYVLNYGSEFFTIVSLPDFA